MNSTDFLDRKATQTGFAELVGITQPAVNKHVGRSLQRGQPYRAWLLAYCERLRGEAAGRSGDDQANLTRSRINESDAKAALTRLAYHEKIGTLIQSAQAESSLVEWADYAIREFENSFSALVHEIESKHGLQVDEKLSLSITTPTLLRIGEYAKKIAKSLTQEVGK